MDEASEAILALKPVTFYYKNDKTNTPQFGLIAEEVADVNPHLVVRDKNSEIYTVRYDAVNAMLLNEFLKEHKKVEEQQATIAKLKSTVAQQRKDFEASIAEQKEKSEATVAQQQKEIQFLTTSLKEQAAQIQKVSALLELNRPKPPVVLLKSARSPRAVLAEPSVLEKSANAPLAVLSNPVVLLKSAPAPVAVFSSAVLPRSVPAPTPVLKRRLCASGRALNPGSRNSTNKLRL